MATSTERATRPPLASLGGKSPRPEIVEGIERLLAFPDAARERLWSVLGPSLSEPVPKRVGHALEEFARAHDVEATALARTVRACRAIVRGAALLDLDVEAVVRDVQLLSDDPRLAELFRSGYDAAKAQVRAEAIRGALTEHGAVLEGVSWRLQQVVASSHDVGFSVAVLTLRVSDRGHTERVTVQVMPEQLRELQLLCERLLGPLR